MRTIKFRAYIKRHECLTEVLSIDFEEKYVLHENFRKDRMEDCEPRSQTDPDCVSDFDQIVLQQFTGLLDKNGKEIYEGDIVECADYEQIAHAWNRWNRLVEYEAKEARFIGIDGEVNIVIGNIHENPDLLK